MLKEKDEACVVPNTVDESLEKLVAEHPFERHHRTTFRHFAGGDTQLQSTYTISHKASILYLLPNRRYELIISDKALTSELTLTGPVAQELALMEAVAQYRAGNILVSDAAMRDIGLHNKPHYCESIVKAIKLATQHRNIDYAINDSGTEAVFTANTGIGAVTYRMVFHAAIKEPIAVVGKIVKHISDEYNRILSKD